MYVFVQFSCVCVFLHVLYPTLYSNSCPRRDNEWLLQRSSSNVAQDGVFSERHDLALWYSALNVWESFEGADNHMSSQSMMLLHTVHITAMYSYYNTAEWIKMYIYLIKDQRSTVWLVFRPLSSTPITVSHEFGTPYKCHVTGPRAKYNTVPVFSSAVGVDSSFDIIPSPVSPPAAHRRIHVNPTDMPVHLRGWHLTIG